MRFTSIDSATELRSSTFGVKRRIKYLFATKSQRPWNTRDITQHNLCLLVSHKFSGYHKYHCFSWYVCLSSDAFLPHLSLAVVLLELYVYNVLTVPTRPTVRLINSRALAKPKSVCLSKTMEAAFRATDSQMALPTKVPVLQTTACLVRTMEIPANQCNSPPPTSRAPHSLADLVHLVSRRLHSGRWP